MLRGKRNVILSRHMTFRHGLNNSLSHIRHIAWNLYMLRFSSWSLLLVFCRSRLRLSYCMLPCRLLGWSLRSCAIVSFISLLWLFRMLSVLSDCVPAFLCQFFTFLGSGMANIMGNVLSGILHTVFSIFLRRDLTIIHQIRRCVLRANKSVFHPLPCNRGFVQNLDVPVGFTGFDLWHFSHLLATRGRHQACPKAKVPSPGLVVISL